MTARLVKYLIILFHLMLGATCTLAVAFVLYANNKPDLEIWHTVVPENEFSAQSDVRTLDEFRKLEASVFRDLREQIIDTLPADRQSPINRYSPGSLSDPARWPQDWNRTYELTTGQPVAGILLLHGLSDSPYSLHHLGEYLHRQGAWVVGLRLPGHGTAPSALTRTRWQDMAAAVELAMRHLQDKTGDKPLYIVGYSNGAALAIHYALTALDRDDLPLPGRLVLLSPAIGVTPAAVLAVWQARLGQLLGLEKLAWQDVLPEYDPYKYQSFAVNAGDQIHRLTAEIQLLLEQQRAAGSLQAFPPTLAFLSAVDATVSTRSVVADFFMRLPPNGHELVVFDLNRREGMENLFAIDPGDAIESLLNDNTLPFTFSVIGNRGLDTRTVTLHSNPANSTPVVFVPQGLTWPEGMYSLSHVALPFPPDDPLYGGPEARKSPGIALGNVALRGEKGALAVPARDMLRQRWNPFYNVVEEGVLAFLLQNSK